MTRAYAEVCFSKHLQDWDGFGINYVETAQTPDYDAYPQDYGGFSILSGAQRGEILNLVFGPEGLRPGIFKMFLDPFHQASAGAAFDHEKTTNWMRFFIREGLKLLGEQGLGMKGIVTLYGPPAFMTKTGSVRGRDLDEKYTAQCAEYIAAFAKHLIDKEGMDIVGASIHNEGEDYHRWPEDGLDSYLGTGHDYNMWWTPAAVASFLPVLRETLDKMGLNGVLAAPGETTNWTRFLQWGYADAIAEDPRAAEAIGLITSHGFFGEPVYSGDHRSAGIDRIREKKPGLHAWVTSTSWSNMDAAFAYELYAAIYSAKVNAVIPWAAVQRSSQWVGGDPNPGCAIRVLDNGEYRVEDGYYFYKQFCRAGQAGMRIARTSCTYSPCCVAAFSGEGTEHPDSIVLVNMGDQPVRVHFKIEGSAARYAAYRTSPAEKYAEIDALAPLDGNCEYIAPAGSVTTFYAADGRTNA